jgi:hypothetical protein
VASPVPLEPVSIAVRFTYVLVDFTSNNTWTQEPPDFDFLQGKSLGVPELGKLPFGATLDPIRQVLTANLSSFIVHGFQIHAYNIMTVNVTVEWLALCFIF